MGDGEAVGDVGAGGVFRVRVMGMGVMVLGLGVEKEKRVVDSGARLDDLMTEWLWKFVG